MQARASQDVDFAVEQLFEILTKPYDVQQRTVGIHVHEEIDVTVRAVVATRDGAEYAEVARPVLRRYSEDVVAFLLQVHGGMPILIVDGGRAGTAGTRVTDPGVASIFTTDTRPILRGMT